MFILHRHMLWSASVSGRGREVSSASIRAISCRMLDIDFGEHLFF
jgi:hypothetical protein